VPTVVRRSYRKYTQAGHEVVMATPGGVVPVVDQASLAAQILKSLDGS
jgi:hypothetical protein